MEQSHRYRGVPSHIHHSIVYRRVSRLSILRAQHPRIKLLAPALVLAVKLHVFLSYHHHTTTSIRSSKTDQMTQEHRARTASDGAKTPLDDKDGSESCQLGRRCGNGNLRQTHSRECLRRRALECAEAETQRHYAIAVAAATERETASRTAVPGRIVLQGVTSTR